MKDSMSSFENFSKESQQHHNSKSESSKKFKSKKNSQIIPNRKESNQ